MQSHPICSNTKSEATRGHTGDFLSHPPSPGTQSLDRISHTTIRKPYSEAEKLTLSAFCKKMERSGYDIQVSRSSSTSTHEQRLNDGIVMLDSKNLGYQCVVINLDLDKEKQYFWQKKRSVSLYLSPINRDQDFDEYCHLSDQKSLLKALLQFQQIYREAAALHLP
jgi:hypothetical protein